MIWIKALKTLPGPGISPPPDICHKIKAIPASIITRIVHTRLGMVSRGVIKEKFFIWRIIPSEGKGEYPKTEYPPSNDLLAENDFNAAVLGSSCGRAIVSDRLIGAIAIGLDLILGKPLLQ